MLSIRLLSMLGLVGMLVPSAAWAGPIGCPQGQACGWSLTVTNLTTSQQLYSANGEILIDESGNLSIAPVSVVNPLFGFNLGSVGGNVDPELVFGLGATNTANVPLVFAFAFSVPLGGFGDGSTPIDTEAALSITLTSSSGSVGGDDVFPILGVNKIVDSQDIRLAPFANVDKGVDIGDLVHDAPGGLATITNDLINGQILNGGPFDLMTVTVAFGLTDNNPGTPGTGVGLSGRVTQTLVPEPSTAALLGLGLVAFSVARRSRHESDRGVQ